MPLRAVKTEEEIANIPLDQEILIELPGGELIEDEKPATKTKTDRVEPTDPGAKTLMAQLEAAQTAQRASDARAQKAERDAAQALQEANEARTRSQSLEGDIINGGLAAAQSERDAAKAAFKAAFEAGDGNAMADAQSRMGRSEAKILTFESGAAEIAERKEVKPEPRQEQVRQQAPDIMEAIDSNAQLFPAEKTWLKAHPDAFGARNNELGVGYERAIKKGLVRGTDAYFEYLEEFMGYKTPETNNEERGSSMQAPVSRTERGSDGRPSNNRVTLSPEERAMAQSMGVSETAFAQGKIKLEQRRREEPEKYK